MKLRHTLLAFALASPTCPADVLMLQDGRTFDNLDLARVEGGVQVTLENGTLLVPEGLIEEALIEGASTYVPRTDEEKEKYENGFVRYRGKWIRESQRERLIERSIDARRDAFEEDEASKAWRNAREETTKRFDYKYTVPQHVFEEYRDQLEAYFDQFAKDWKVRIKKSGRNSGRLMVNLYGSRAEFIKTAGAGRGTLGYFKFIGEVYDLNIYYDRTDPEGTREVMFHEVNHYLQKLIDQAFKYPHWPGESLAEYYGAGSWDQDEQELEVGGIQEGRLAQIQADMAAGKRIGLEELITRDRFEDYTWGWSLVHFLMNDERYAKDFRKFFLGLAKARDVEREPRAWGAVILQAVPPEEVWIAFQKYLSLDSPEEVEQLQDEWHAYVEELEITSARGKERAAVQAWQSERREVRAERLFREAIEAGSTNPVTYYQFGNMLYGNGDRDEAAEMWRRACELDPMSAEYHFSVGHALRKKDKAESKRLIALAEELDPEVEDKAYVSSMRR